jgi:hypothetical protein
VHRDVERGSDLVVRPALSEKPEHVGFAVGQAPGVNAWCRVAMGADQARRLLEQADGFVKGVHGSESVLARGPESQGGC